MKKGISMLLAVILLGMACFPAGMRSLAAAEDMEFEFEDDFCDGESEEASEEPVYTGPEYDYEHLVIGNPTPLSGNFTTQMWGYNTSDVDITALINAYNLVYWDFDTGNFRTDQRCVSEDQEHELDWRSGRLHARRAFRRAGRNHRRCDRQRRGRLHQGEGERGRGAEANGGRGPPPDEESVRRT